MTAIFALPPQINYACGHIQIYLYRICKIIDIVFKDSSYRMEFKGRKISMKRIAFILILTVFMSTLAACKSENTSPLPQKSTDTQKELFFGEWTIAKNIANNKVSAYSKDEIEKMIGKKVTYSDALASFDNNICSSPSYKEMTIITKEEDKNNYVKFADLGIKSESIISIEVFTNKEQSKSWISPGSFFYVKDQNTLILVDDGACFELTRSK